MEEAQYEQWNIHDQDHGTNRPAREMVNNNANPTDPPGRKVIGYLKKAITQRGNEGANR